MSIEIVLAAAAILFPLWMRWFISTPSERTEWFRELKKIGEGLKR